MSALAIYGAGGFAREVAPLLAEPGAVFVSDVVEETQRLIGGRPVIDFAALCSPAYRARPVVVAIAKPAIRRAIADRCRQAGLGFGEIVAQTHRRLDRVTLGEGAVVCDHTIITSDVAIGRHFQLNLYAYVAHDVSVGDFVTFAPRVCCNGNVEIGDGAYLGTGAIIREGTAQRALRIGAGAVIGMGAVVTKDVPAGTVVFGNPARVVAEVDA